MNLNLPILDQLTGCRNLLIAGMGGGFDVFCGLPIYFDLRRRGQAVHLASLSFSPHLGRLKGGIPLAGGVVGVTAAHRGTVVYFPELYLSRWFEETRGEEVPIWCFGMTGAQPMLAGYRALVEHLQIDGILLIDGGMDSLIRGDEATLGTTVEDTLTLTVVSDLDDVPVRLIACVGFGAEREVAHAHILENIAALAEAGGFLGTCSLVREMEAYREYEAAVLHAHGQPCQDPSVINASIVSAVQGRFGDYHVTAKTVGSRLWISPLMAIYWFFDLPAVAERSLFVSQLRFTQNFREIAQVMTEIRRSLPLRPASGIPLP
jgi:hypothetical protein